MALGAAATAEQILRVGPNSKQTGDLVHDGIVVVEGAVTGRIHAREVRVLARGTVDASIHADVVKVVGSVRGIVKCATFLAGAGCSVHDADVQCETIGIEPGAQYNGTTRTLRPNSIPRFNYQASMDRLNSGAVTAGRRDPQFGRGGLAVVEGGRSPALPDLPPVSPDDRIYHSPRA